MMRLAVVLAALLVSGCNYLEENIPVLGKDPADYRYRKCVADAVPNYAANASAGDEHVEGIIRLCRAASGLDVIRVDTTGGIHRPDDPTEQTPERQALFEELIRD